MNELIKLRQTELLTLSNQAKSLYAAIESAGDKATTEDRNKWETLVADGKAKRTALNVLIDADENEQAASGGTGQRKTNDAPANVSNYVPRKSNGQIVVESKEFKENNGQTMSRVPVPFEVKALISGLTSGAGGANVMGDRIAEFVEVARQRPASILNYINVSQTSSSAVEYVEFTSRTNAAVEVVEAGTKPEGSLTFAIKTAAVKTIAEWIPATRQILADAPRLAAMIDGELTYMIQERLENQIIAGDGVGANILGIVGTAGIQARVHAVSGARFNAADTIADSLRRGITDLNLEFYDADVILVHPAQGEALDLLKTTQLAYVSVFDPVLMRVWRKPVLETMAMTAGTALVMQGKLAATLWDRQQTEIRVGEPNAYFLTNMVAVLAEMRAAFAVTRPKAIEKITGLP